MRVLFIGDVVGPDGCCVLTEKLPTMRKKWGLDLVIANGENSADSGMGITPAIADSFLASGVDVITSGNHIWQSGDIYPYLKDHSYPIIRPHNYDNDKPGTGIFSLGNITVVNLIGRDGMPEQVKCPFQSASSLIQTIPKENLIFVDIHGVNPGEKKTLAYSLLERAQVVVGTHTHTQTADAQILAGKVAYISDLGMTGVLSGIQGGTVDFFIRYYTEPVMPPVELATGTASLQGAVVELDTYSKVSSRIVPITLSADQKVPTFDIAMNY